MSSVLLERTSDECCGVGGFARAFATARRDGVIPKANHTDGEDAGLCRL
jgi:hypothetical protein